VIHEEAPTAAQRYRRLALEREAYLRRARECAALTVPAVCPPEGHPSTEVLPEPDSSIGAVCATALASKLAVALLPPGARFMRLSVPAELLMAASQVVGGAVQLTPEQERLLSDLEDVVISEVERRAWRAVFYRLMLRLVITGNACVYLQPDNRLRVFGLEHFVLRRDGSGRVAEAIIREHVSIESLPEEQRSIASRSPTTSHISTTLGTPAADLYTCLKAVGEGEWQVWQELGETRLDETSGTYRAEDMPWLFPAWNRIDGEHYGRSKVDDHLADLRYANGLQRDVADGAAMGARNLIFQRPNATGGLNLRRRIAQARNGDVVVGNPEDVSWMQFSNVAGVQFAAQELARVQQELRAAFLMTNSVQRHAERVTAYELRVMIEELESVLGGVYSALGAELMGPLARALMVQMADQGKLRQEALQAIEPVILTGVEALGREQDIQRVTMAIQGAQAFGPAATERLKMGELLNRYMTALGLTNCIKTEEEVIADREAAMMQAMAAQSVPRMAKSIADAAINAAPPPGTVPSPA